MPTRPVGSQSRYPDILRTKVAVKDEADPKRREFQPYRLVRLLLLIASPLVTLGLAIKLAHLFQ